MNRSYKRVDFAALKRRIPIEGVCDFLGLSLKKMGNGQLRGQCPVCEHDSARAFVVTPAAGVFFCFADCRTGGDCIELVARVRQLSTRDAARLLADTFKESA